MSAVSTLTRAEAHQLIDDAASDLGTVDGIHDGIAAIAAHWGIAGWWNENADPESLAESLHQHVDDCALSDDSRANGPQDDDDTGLTTPEEE